MLSVITLLVPLYMEPIIVDLDPPEMRAAFNTWLMGRYPDQQNELERQLQSDGSGRCEYLCPSGLNLSVE